MKRRISNSFGTLAINMAVGTCQGNMKSSSSVNKDSNASTLRSSENTPDCSGSYSGILPCASCEGIETEQQLKEDITYTLTTRYLGKREEALTLSKARMAPLIRFRTEKSKD